MAELHKGASIMPTKLELVQAWMASQRWYAGKGTSPGDAPRVVAPRRPRRRGRRRGPPRRGHLRTRAGRLPGAAHLPRRPARGCRARARRHDGAQRARPPLGLRRPARPRLCRPAGRARPGPGAGRVHGRERRVRRHRRARARRGLGPGRPRRGLARCSPASSPTPRSSSSASTPTAAAEPLIVKVFRMLSAGENPDVVLQSALREAGSTRVPAVVGRSPGSGPSRTPRARRRGWANGIGHLAFAQEFLPGVEDAWRVALAAVASGDDFSGPARALGEVTAEIHATLADALGTTPTSPEPPATILDEMRQRYAAAAAEVAALHVHEDAVSASSTPPRARAGLRCSGSTATTTSARCWTCPRAGGSRSTSRASRCGRSPSGSSPTVDPRHRRDAAHVRLRRWRRRALDRRLRRRDWVASAQQALPRRLCRCRRRGPARPPGAARRVRARQGHLRGRLRGPQPADVARHPARRRRATRLRALDPAHDRRHRTPGGHHRDPDPRPRSQRCRSTPSSRAGTGSPTTCSATTSGPVGSPSACYRPLAALGPGALRRRRGARPRARGATASGRLTSPDFDSDP